MLRLILVLFLTRLSIAGYVLQDSYMPSNFFDMFNFFTGPDPTQGYVKFVDQGTAQGAGILTKGDASVKFGVDSKTVAPAEGRMSVRLESKKSYNQGLIVVDLAHMPGSICGTWPAFWTIGPDWPSNGEIDIIEGVNSQKSNAMTLHTGAGCSINNAGNQRFAGSIKTNNCDIHAPNQGDNVGCSIATQDTTNYGDGFNSEGGGVYATEWTPDAISIYHFSRSNIPADLNAGNPDPSTWGEPQAVFNGCDFRTAVNNQTIIFDTTFCGQWAGQDAVWKADAVCSKKAATCQAYVQNNPADFAEAFWEVNSVKVYEQNSGYIGSPPAPAPSAPASSAPASSAPASSAPAPALPSSAAAIPPPAQSAPSPADSGRPPRASGRPMRSGPPPGAAPPILSQQVGSSIPPSTFSTSPTIPTPQPSQAAPQTSTRTMVVEMTTTLTEDAVGFQKATMVPTTAIAARPPGDCTGTRVKEGCISMGARGRNTEDSRKKIHGGQGRWVVDRAGGDLLW